VLDNDCDTGPNSFVKDGYLFTYAAARDAGSRDRYTITARPVDQGVTGRISVYSDQTGVVRSTAENRAAVPFHSAVPW
jgi:hypothetical protein